MKKIMLMLVSLALVIALISCSSKVAGIIPEQLVSISTDYDTDTQMEEYIDGNKEITIMKEKTDNGDFQERWRKIITKDLENKPVDEEYYRYNTAYLNKSYQYEDIQLGKRNVNLLTEIVFKDSNGVICEKETYEYDANQRLIKKTRYSTANGEEEVLNYHTYDYADESTLPGTINFHIPDQEPSPRSHHVFEYDEIGNKVSDIYIHFTFDYGFIILSKNTYAYDEQGKLIKEDYFTYYLNEQYYHLEWTADYIYTNGQLSKIEKRDNSGKIVAQKVF